MRADEVRVADILHAIKRIQIYLIGLDQQSFLCNFMAQDAIIRQIEIIGESAAGLSPEFKSARPALPWRNIIGMRNVLIHQYGEVDLDQVWTVATVDTLQLLLELQQP